VQNPLGPYGNAVAAILAVVVVIAALASHVVPGLVPGPWLDNAALLAIGVVFGTQVVQNGTQTKATAALDAAGALNTRVGLLELGATAHRAADFPPGAPAATVAPPTTTGGPPASGTA
jgi:hypothetical protein